MSTIAPSIGVNIRVTGHCNQGDRKYMEDAFSVAYQLRNDENDLEYAYFGMFDGHGGRDAAIFAKEHLMNAIVSQKSFWSDNDDNVLRAIKEGFVATHMAMWKEVGKWPQTISGLPSTSGTTASVVFIRNGKLYVGHVGDSAVVLGFKDPVTKHYTARSLTSDHKPELPAERKRIEDGGGSVMSKCGVQRVVWNRPRIGHKGPIRRSTHIDQIPFLAVARSLGDLWSYDYLHSQFIVSPEPDVCVVPIDYRRDRCVIVATDGVWNMISSRDAVRYVEIAERENEKHFLANDSIPIGSQPLINPSRMLVEKALSLWYVRKKRADNATVLTIMIDPPGPPKSEVLLRKRMLFKLRPRDENTTNYSYTSVEVLHKTVPIGYEQPMNRNPPPEVDQSASNPARCSQHQSPPKGQSIFLIRPKEEPDSRSVISSDYDIYMKGSICLQRNGSSKLVADSVVEDEVRREDLWRMAPTPPLPEEQSPTRCIPYRPHIPLRRAHSIWMKPSEGSTMKCETSHPTPDKPLCPQIATCSTQSSYSNVAASEIKQPTSDSRTNQASLNAKYTNADVHGNNSPCPLTSNVAPPPPPLQPPPILKSNKLKSGSKRKSFPGKRELYFLLAKQSRLGRNHLSPSTLYRNTRVGHITRSRVRLRKSVV